MTMPQHMQALQDANTVRRRRWELYREVVELDHDPARGLLADMLDYGCTTHEDVRRALAKLNVVDAVNWVPGIRRPIARRYVAAVGASEHRTVGELSARQRTALAELLRGGLDAVKHAEVEGRLAA